MSHEMTLGPGMAPTFTVNGIQHALRWLHGLWSYPAREFASTIGYSSDGRRLVSKMTGEWGDKFVEGTHFFRARPHEGPSGAGLSLATAPMANDREITAPAVHSHSGGKVPIHLTMEGIMLVCELSATPTAQKIREELGITKRTAMPIAPIAQPLAIDMAALAQTIAAATAAAVAQVMAPMLDRLTARMDERPALPAPDRQRLSEVRAAAGRLGGLARAANAKTQPEEATKAPPVLEHKMSEPRVHVATRHGLQEDPQTYVLRHARQLGSDFSAPVIANKARNGLKASATYAALAELVATGKLTVVGTTSRGASIYHVVAGLADDNHAPPSPVPTPPPELRKHIAAPEGLARPNWNDKTACAVFLLDVLEPYPYSQVIYRADMLRLLVSDSERKKLGLRVTDLDPVIKILVDGKALKLNREWVNTSGYLCQEYASLVGTGVGGGPRRNGL